MTPNPSFWLPAILLFGCGGSTRPPSGDASPPHAANSAALQGASRQPPPEQAPSKEASAPEAPTAPQAPPKVAYFLHGHGELDARGDAHEGIEAVRHATIFRKILERNLNFRTDVLGGAALLKDVPAEANLVVILGPMTPLLKEELEALSRYVARGGALFVALEAEKPSEPGEAPVSAGRDANPKLAEMLGLRFDPALLVHPTKHVRLRNDESDRTLIISDTFSSHASVTTLHDNAPRAVIVLFGAGSLDRAPRTNVSIDFAVSSMAGSFRDRNGNYRKDYKMEPSDSFNLAAAITLPGSNGTEARAFALADADGLSDFALRELIANQLLLVDVVKWLVPPK
jgi:hypothetical protein